MTLKAKILEAFEGKVVRKDLVSLVKGNNPVPAYVLEYLLGQYCAVDDEAIIQAGVEKVRNVIKDNYVHRSDAEVVKHKIRAAGTHKIIDKINVVLDEHSNLYRAEFANLGLRGVPVSDVIVDTHQKLLSGGGVWCILTMTYTHDDEAEVRWVIADLKPIQVAGVSLEEYTARRADFTTDEWIDLLMHSIGLNPEFFSKRDKLIQLSRLVPHVENNYNFIELGIWSCQVYNVIHT
jgi:ATP-dependent Lon protease